MGVSSDLLRKAKETGFDDLLDAEIVVYYLKRANGDIDKAIVLAEAEPVQERPYGH